MKTSQNTRITRKIEKIENNKKIRIIEKIEKIENYRDALNG